MTRAQQIRMPKTRRDADTYAVTASFCTVHALVGTNVTSQPLSFPASQLRLTYDILGRVTAKSDRLGNWTRTAYSPDGNVAATTYPNGATRVVSNLWGRVVSVTGTAVTPEFRTYGVTPDGLRWTRTVSGETPDSPRFRTVYRDMLGRTVREETPAFGGGTVAISRSHDSLGRLLSETKSFTTNGVTEIAERTLYAYDPLGNRETVCRDADLDGEIGYAETDDITRTTEGYVVKDGEVWRETVSETWPEDGVDSPFVTGKTRVRLTGLAGGASASESEDAGGNVTRTFRTVARNGGVAETVSLLPASVLPRLSRTVYGNETLAVSETGVTNSFAYDGLGRQTARTDGRGNTARTGYGDAGLAAWTEDAAGNRTSYAYDAFGNRISVTDPLGNTVYTEYDLRGQAVARRGATYPVEYGYDVFGQRVSMRTFRDENGAGDETRWIHDPATGLLLRKVYADGKGPSYSYTPDGKLLTRTWARGVKKKYVYDSTNKLARISYSDGTPDVTYGYDRRGNILFAGVEGTVSNSFSYSRSGICTNLYQDEVSISRKTDDFFRFCGYSTLGVDVTYVYEDNGERVHSVEWERNNYTGSVIYCYLPGGDIPASVSNSCGFSSVSSFERKRDLISGVTNFLSDYAINSFEYENDELGRKIKRVDDRSVTNLFFYNEKSELVSARIGASDYAYSYDGNGNRSCDGHDGCVWSYAINSVNQVTNRTDALGECVPIEYDDDGNMIRNGPWRYVWDAENRLLLASNDNHIVSYVYDHEGRAVRRSVNSVSETLVWDHDRLLFRMGSSISEGFVWGLGINGGLLGNGGAGGLLAIAGNDGIAYPVFDAAGNVSAMLKEGVARCRYSPFGEFEGGETDAIMFGFSTKRITPHCGFLEFQYRMALPNLGRFISRDPLMEESNPYTFCRNNPVCRYDPNGLSSGNNCCRQEDIDDWKAKNRKVIDNLVKKECLSDIRCGKCANNEKANYSNQTKAITVCTEVTNSILIHEIQHAGQCGKDFGDCEGDPVRGPSMAECRKRLYSEFEAYACEDLARPDEYYGACSRYKFSMGKIDSCLERAWDSVRINCPNCMHFKHDRPDLGKDFKKPENCLIKSWQWRR